jgi:hypothetical protein
MMVAFPFAILFGVLWGSLGLGAALAIYGGTAFTVFLLVGGVHLLSGD